MSDLSLPWLSGAGFDTLAAWIVGIVLAGIALGFLVRFVLPALQLSHRLRRAVDGLEGITPGSADPEVISREVMVAPPLSHLWREYAQTLHPARREGKRLWRATAMAESFFTDHALVDTPLKTEFYKHLPGILTGLGIIGTFSGLIIGLTHFDVSSDTEVVRASLRALIQGVGHAFRISAVAIGLAMLFTWVEKSLVTRCYRHVTRLTQLIDSLFDSGVGEEYLARLVAASEATAGQSRELRQALVTELRQAMTALVSEQREAAAQQQAQLVAFIAKSVSESVAQTLSDPMARVAAAMEKLGASQGNALAGALESALDRFSGEFTQTLGGKQQHLEQLLAETTQGLSTLVADFHRLVAQLESLTRQSVNQAAGQLDAAGKGIASSASAIGTAGRDLGQAAAALAQASTLASDVLVEQRDTREALSRMLGDLRDTVENARREASLTGNLVTRMEQAATTLAQATQRADQYLQGVNEVITRAHGAFAENVERTLHQSNTQFQRELANAVDTLRGAMEELGDVLDQTTGSFRR